MYVYIYTYLIYFDLLSGNCRSVFGAEVGLKVQVSPNLIAARRTMDIDFLHRAELPLSLFPKAKKSSRTGCDKVVTAFQLYCQTLIDSSSHAFITI